MCTQNGRYPRPLQLEHRDGDHDLSLTPERRIKVAYSTGAVPIDAMRAVDREPAAKPRSGDLVLARIDVLGQHTRLELRNGRRAFLFEGDHAIVCYGNRYASAQFEAELPEDFSPCDLVAAGGIASRMLELHTNMREPTQITPIGPVLDRNGHRLNLENWALPEIEAPPRMPPTYAVVGTGMNAGKTTTAANLVRGLSRAGYRVGACKVTGTGAGGDVWRMTDAGAELVLDFTRAGMASTYLAPIVRVERAARLLRAHLASAGADVIVMEVADGVFQRETAALLGSEAFREGIDGVLFAASDAVGAAAGVEGLHKLGLRVLAVSGVLTASPLFAREASEMIEDVPILDIAGLREVSALGECGFVAHGTPGSPSARVAENGDRAAWRDDASARSLVVR